MLTLPLSVHPEFAKATYAENRRIGASSRYRSVAEIASETAAFYRLRLDDMIDRDSHRHIVTPRYVGMLLSHELTGASLKEIGRVFGGRDHTTVLHGVRSITKRIGFNIELRSQVDHLRRICSE